MKIAINGRLLANRLEGIGHYTVEVIRHMALQQPEDEFVLLIDRNIDKQIFEAPNITYFRTGLPTRHPLLWYLWFEYFIPRALKKIKANVFFSPEAMLSLRCQIPTLMTVHDLAYLHYPEASIPSHRSFLERRMSRYINRANRISCVSQFTFNDVLLQFPENEEKCFVAYNGLRSSFSPITEKQSVKVRGQLSNGSPYILYLGAIHPRKNILKLIQAFEHFKNESSSNHQLVLAGRMAWNSNEIRKRIESSDCRSDIIHISEFEDNLTDIVGAASCICYISLFEGFGLPVLEAMGSGVPVITSKNSAMEEICGNAAYYIDPHDENSIASGMNKVLTNRHLQSEMIELGLQRSEAFKWADTAQKVYSELRAINVKNIRNISSSQS